MGILNLNDRIELTSFFPDITAITQSTTGNDIENFLAKNTSSTFTLSEDYLNPVVLTNTATHSVFVIAINQQTGQRYSIKKNDDYSTQYGETWTEGYYKICVRQYLRAYDVSYSANGTQGTEFYELTKKPLYWNKSKVSFMTYIQPGKFWMGSPVGEMGRSTASNEGLHYVTISNPFYIQRTATTCYLANTILNCNGCTPLNYYTSGTTSNGVTTYTQYSESLTILSKSTEYSSCFARGTATDDYLNYKFAYYTTLSHAPRTNISFAKYDRSPKSGSNVYTRRTGFGAPGASSAYKGFRVISSIAYPYPYATGSYLDPEEDRSLLHGMNLKLKIDGYVWDLPTESQWEYCCRAGIKQPFNNGESLKFKTTHETGVAADDQVPQPNINEICWFYPHNNTVHSVGLLKPNRWGLYDISGNIWEICKDFYVANNTSHTNGDEAISGSLLGSTAFVNIRGGGYSSGGKQCRAAARGLSMYPTTAGATYGVRLILRAES